MIICTNYLEQSKFILISCAALILCLFNHLVYPYGHCGLHSGKVLVEGKFYNVKLLSVGDVFEEGLLYVPSCSSNSNKSWVSIETDIDSINKDLLLDVFFKKKPSAISLFPFSALGIEAVLSPDALEFNVYGGVKVKIGKKFLHLEKKSTKPAIFRVTSIKGHAYITVDNEIVQKELPDFLSSFSLPKAKPDEFKEKILPNGATLRRRSLSDSDTPRVYSPKVRTNTYK